MVEGIYLDNAATTPISNEVWREMRVFKDYYGNPSSVHDAGRLAREKIENTREIILDYLKAKGGDVIFTSGGSESNTLAICGLFDYLMINKKKTIITTQIEHPSVLNACKHMEDLGFTVIYMPVLGDGRVDIEYLDEVMAANKDNLGLVSIQMVNSEIGAIQCIGDIGDLCEEYQVLFHTDAVQGIGRVNIDVERFHIDLLSMSGHKVHAPKGIGALYVRDRSILAPVIYGGDQEYGLRSGTENTLGIVALGKAIEQICRFGEIWNWRIDGLNSRFYSSLRRQMEIPFFINGAVGRGGIISLTIPHVEGNALMLALNDKGIYVSTGSACSANKPDASHILTAIGIDENDALCTIRVSLSDLTTEDDIDIAAKEIAELSARLHSMACS